ncbi:hypothetical protein, partial [Burkholderia sola]
VAPDVGALAAWLREHA